MTRDPVPAWWPNQDGSTVVIELYSGWRLTIEIAGTNAFLRKFRVDGLGSDSKMYLPLDALAVLSAAVVGRALGPALTDLALSSWGLRR